ncbi:MAG: hypothetical protein EZS28_000142 [Streblomastix strix]|uniref:Uncharacterized protein n=1 Tax=Streblomastix strix TaxID=222440 RepID=A0A5J4XAZ5_9EUKA|nr:MAG: hypothetical protein EZS28_000142 [Streblomastix strix]
MACSCLGPSSSKGQFKAIAKNFHLPDGNEEQQKISYGKQENDCETLEVIFKDKKDDNGLLTEPASTDVVLLLFNRKPFPGLIRLLQHSDIGIVSDSMRSIVNILSSGSESTQMSETHPHLSAMKECNGIEELYSVYENNGDQTCQNLASICIGHLFRGQEIENKKQNIIDNLKQLLIDSDVWIREASQRSLKDLAQNLENRNEIMTGDFMKNMARDLQCKISGNDEQKNETMLQQEKYCKILHISLQGREDDDLRKKALNCGVIESILHILEQRDLSQITHPYILVFYSILTPSNESIKQLILSKKPYNGLTRILFHSDNNICLDSIKSIDILLSYKTDSSSYCDSNPQFNVMQECSGLEKILSIFQRSNVKQIKDISSFCIGRLFEGRQIDNVIIKKEILFHLKRLIIDSELQTNITSKSILMGLVKNEVNRSEILKSDLIKNIVEDLKQPPKGDAIKKQEMSCELILRLFKDKEDEQGRLIVIDGKIIDTFINIFEKRELILISRPYCEAFNCLLAPANDAVKLKIFGKKPYSGLLRILDHEDINILEDILYSIFILLSSGLNTVQHSQVHPHYKVIQQYGGTEKIIQLFKNNKNKRTKDFSSICFSFLYKAREITDSFQKNEIIPHLKTLIYDQDVQIKKNARIGLTLLAENKLNCEEILKGNFLNDIVHGLRNEYGEGKQTLEQEKLSGQCEFLTDLIVVCKNDDVRKICIQAGIGDALFRFIESQDLNSILQSQLYTNTLFTLLNGGSDIRQQLFDIKPYPSLLHLLQHPNSEVIFQSICQILKFLISGSIGVQYQSLHPHIPIMQDNNGIEKIFDLFKRNLDKETKDYSSICIGYLFKGQQIIDIEMKQVLLHLIRIIYDNNEYIKANSKQGLKFLAENPDNCEQILKSDFLKNISEYLRQPIEGNDQQKKGILNKQQTGCEIIYAIFNGREDSQGRQNTIDIGIVDQLIRILNNYKMNIISEAYVNALLSISGPASDQIKEQIVAKKAYQSLIRIFDHNKIEVINSSIQIIDNLLSVYENKELDLSTHPHFDQMQQYNGIDKIYQLFKKNMNKDIRNRSALCIGRLYCAQSINNQIMKVEVITHLKKLTEDPILQDSAYKRLLELAQNDGNRIEIMNSTMLKGIALDLQKEIIGSEDNINEIKERQFKLCNFLISLMKRLEDQEIMKLVISSGISQSLTIMFQKRDLESITRIFSQTFYNITAASKVDARVMIFEKQPFPGLIRLLNHSNIDIVSDSLNSIMNIVLAGTETTIETNVHPYFNEVNGCNGIEAIYSIFQQNINNDLKNTSAILFGHLYRSREIKDINQRIEIISHLKTLLNNSNIEIKKNGKNAIVDLGQNEINRADILSIEFLKSISDDLQIQNRSALSDNDQIALVVRDLMIPLQGATAEQKQDILIIQDYGFKYLFSLIEDQDKMGRLLIDQGVIDTIIYILETRDLPDINRKLLSIIGYICLSSDDDSMYIVQRKNPFPGLIRLFNHAEEKTINTSIEIIFYILLAAHRKTEAKSLHPYFDNVASVGIEKILELFRRTTDKETRDYSAGSLGIVFRARAINDPTMRHEIIQYCRALLYDPEKKLSSMGLCALNFNRSDFLYGISLQDMANDFGRPLYGNEEERNNIIRMQECHCTLIFSMFAGIEDDQLRQFVLNSYFPDSLLRIKMKLVHKSRGKGHFQDY